MSNYGLTKIVPPQIIVLAWIFEHNKFPRCQVQTPVGVVSSAILMGGAVRVWLLVFCLFDLSNEKNPGCLVYIGDYTTQLYMGNYGDYNYNKPL